MTDAIRHQLQATLGAAYSLERELGGGGMSRVFVAEDVALQRKVVVKVLPPELMAGINVERFNREILLAAKLQHPHIVPVLSAGVTDGLPFYTMPFVDGQSLRARLVVGPLRIAEAIGVLRDVAKALAYAHDRGIVHRDIKPDNILLTGGSATVTDFGIAKAISASRSGSPVEALTQIGTSIGTPAYMSPEQAAGDPLTDHRADIYSFGCLAYELIAGRPPFTDSSPRKLLAAHMSAVPEMISAVRPDTPTELAAIIMRCLEKDPDARPQRASDLVSSIESVSSGGDRPAMPLALLGGPALFRRALAIYIAAFLAVAVLAKAAIVGIGLPDWVFPGALIVMALGLPVVLWTGYVARVAHHAMTVTPTFTPGGSPSLQHGTMASIAMKASPHVSWRRTARGGAVAMGAFIALVAAFMTLRALGIGPFGSLTASGAMKARATILLDDFAVTNGDSALGRVVSDAVRTSLNESSIISLMAPTEIGAALQRMQLPPTARVTGAVARQLALREGVRAIADGEVAQIGGSYVVTVRLITADSGKELVSYRASAVDAAGLIAASDAVSRKLRAKIGESLKRVQSAPPLAQVTTSSVEALRLYGDGYRALTVEGDNRTAESLLRRAVSIDSTFGAAWRALAAAMSNMGGSRAEIASAADRAYSLRDRMTERERDYAVGQYYRNGSGRDRAKSLEAYERMLGRGDSSALNNIAMWYATRRQFARAETAWVRGFRRNTTLGVYARNLISNAHGGGDFQLSDSVFASLPLAVRPDAYVESRLFDRGDMEALSKLLDSASRPAQRRVRSAYSLARGKVADWNRIGDRRSAAETIVDLAGAGIPVDRELSVMDSGLVRSPLNKIPMLDRPDLDVAHAYALANHPDRARAVLAQYDREVTDTSLRRAQQPDLHQALSAVAAAEKRWLVAVSEARKADSLPDGPVSTCTFCLTLSLFRLFADGEMPDSALAQYEIYKNSAWGRREIRGPDMILGAAGYERLGRLYEAKGDPVKAAENYRAFIDLWKDADPRLQPRIADARRRVAALIKLEQPARR